MIILANSTWICFEFQIFANPMCGHTGHMTWSPSILFETETYLTAALAADIAFRSGISKKAVFTQIGEFVPLAAKINAETFLPLTQLLRFCTSIAETNLNTSAGVSCRNLVRIDSLTHFYFSAFFADVFHVSLELSIPYPETWRMPGFPLRVAVSFVQYKF